MESQRREERLLTKLVDISSNACSWNEANTWWWNMAFGFETIVFDTVCSSIVARRCLLLSDNVCRKIRSTKVLFFVWVTRMKENHFSICHPRRTDWLAIKIGCHVRIRCHSYCFILAQRSFLICVVWLQKVVINFSISCRQLVQRFQNRTTNGKQSLV